MYEKVEELQQVLKDHISTKNALKVWCHSSSSCVGACREGLLALKTGNLYELWELKYSNRHWPDLHIHRMLLRMESQLVVKN